MATLYELTSPFNVGTLTNPRNVTKLKLTSFACTATPSLAPAATGELNLTLTDVDTGWQEEVKYKDASVLEFFAQTAPTPPTGATYEDVLALAVFTKLITDGKLPPGTLSCTVS